MDGAGEFDSGETSYRFPAAPKADHIRSRGSFPIRQKIKEKLARLYPDVHTPAISTVHAVLDRRGLVKRREYPHDTPLHPFIPSRTFAVNSSFHPDSGSGLCPFLLPKLNACCCDLSMFDAHLTAGTETRMGSMVARST
jgi:hypothetical protein